MSRKSEIETQISFGKSVMRDWTGGQNQKSWAKRLQAGPEKADFDFQKTPALLKFPEEHSRAVAGKKSISGV